MSLFEHETSRRSPGEVVADWWHDWRQRATSSSELAACDQHDVDRIAHDAGLTTYELQQLVRRGPHGADLLLARMAVLGLDPHEVDEVDRATFLDLQRVCTNCDPKRRCKRDLGKRPDDAVWEDYCPNVATLKMLNAMPWASRREW